MMGLEDSRIRIGGLEEPDIHMVGDFELGIRIVGHKELNSHSFEDINFGWDKQGPISKGNNNLVQNLQSLLEQLHFPSSKHIHIAIEELQTLEIVNPHCLALEEKLIVQYLNSLVKMN
jgi:hypothetical protein